MWKHLPHVCLSQDILSCLSLQSFTHLGTRRKRKRGVKWKPGCDILDPLVDAVPLTLRLRQGSPPGCEDSDLHHECEMLKVMWFPTLGGKRNSTRAATPRHTWAPCRMFDPVQNILSDSWSMPKGAWYLVLSKLSTLGKCPSI